VSGRKLIHDMPRKIRAGELPGETALRRS
jgi:hypothetical protein